MTYYEFYDKAWNDIWDSLTDKGKEKILSTQGLKGNLYCSIVSVVSSFIAGAYQNDVDKVIDIIRMETGIGIEKQVIENILRRLYEI